MKIQEIEIAGYRSVDALRLELSNVTVLVGPNGCGKSNIYQSINLIAAAANGSFARRIAEEGGMQSILWAGARRKQEQLRTRLSVRFDQLTYCLEFGLIPISERRAGNPKLTAPDEMDPRELSIFKRDPDIKEETVEIKAGARTANLLKRTRSLVIARDVDGEERAYREKIGESESVLSELREPQSYPELALLQSQFLRWRFYHDFRTDLQSPIREPQLATMTPILSHDGRDLAATLATIRAVGDRRKLHQTIVKAFPDSRVDIEEEGGILNMQMRFPGLSRPLDARELSDGILQYLCLVAALLTPRPAPFMVLNEPETSIHVDLMKPLADLIAAASESSQILLTTHSKELARFLRLKGASTYELEKIDGATCLKGKRKVKTHEQKMRGWLGPETEMEDV